MPKELVDDLGVYQDDFDDIWKGTLKAEGGYTVDHAGPTNYGITQSTYNAYLTSKGQKPKSVKNLPEPEAKEVARELYYVQPKIDKLPNKKVKRAVFDHGLNAGQGTAIKSMQEIIGTDTDGLIGPNTIKALQDKIEKKGEKPVLNELIDKREQHYKDLIQKNPKRYKKFEKGWMNRLKELRKDLDLSMVNPFHVKQAEAAGVGDLTDDLGIFENASQLNNLGYLKDDLGIFEEKADLGKIVQKSVLEMAKGAGYGFEGIAAGTGGLMTILAKNMRIDEVKAQSILKRGMKDQEWIDKRNKVADKVELWGKTAKDFWEKAMKQGVMAPDPELMAGSFRQNPSWTRAGVHIAQAVPSLGAAVTMGAVAGPAAGLTFLSLLDSESIHAEALESGASLGKANALFTASAIGTAILEKGPLDFFIKGGTGKLVRDVLEGAGREGSQEFLQNTWQNIIRKVGIDRSQDIFEGALESAIAGAGSGGIIGGLSSRSKDVVKQAVEAGVSKTELKAVDTMAQATIVANAEKIEEMIIDLKPVDNIAKDEEGKPIEVNPQEEGQVIDVTVAAPQKKNEGQHRSLIYDIEGIEEDIKISKQAKGQTQDDSTKTQISEQRETGEAEKVLESESEKALIEEAKKSKTVDEFLKSSKKYFEISSNIIYQDGKIYYMYNSAGDARSAARNKIFQEVHEGQKIYYRATDNKNEHKLGDIKSKNIRDKFEEKGMSVSEHANYKDFFDYKYIGVVTGDVVGNGSDGEPVLRNVKWLSPPSNTIPEDYSPEKILNKSTLTREEVEDAEYIYGNPPLSKEQLIEIYNKAHEEKNDATKAQVPEQGQAGKAEEVSSIPMEKKKLKTANTATMLPESEEIKQFYKKMVSEGKLTQEDVDKELSPDIFVNDDNTPLKTSDPVEVEVYRGHGRTDKSSIYAPGADGPVFKDSTYYAMDEKTASKFGEKIEKKNVSLNNPYVINNDDDLKTLFGQNIPFENTERTPLFEKAKETLINKGHDGLIVNVPSSADIDISGKGVKRIREIFDQSQLIEFKKEPDENIKKAESGLKPKEPAYTVTKADLVPTRGPDGKIVWVAENVVETRETLSGEEGRPALEKPLQEEQSNISKMVGGFVQAINTKTLPNDPKGLRNLAQKLTGVDPKENYDEIYDSLEMALNQSAFIDQDNIKNGLDFAQREEDKLPLRNRSLETIKNQQFSTPLTLATAANYALDVKPGDVVLEPTAGTGNMIVPFVKKGVKYIANELDPRRLEVLKTTDKIQEVTNQDFLKYSGPVPTVIIGNPPFGALSKGKYVDFAADYKPSNIDQRFIDKMLRTLPEGGRISVITSQGTGTGASSVSFRKWLREKHTLLATFESPPGAYKKRGSPTIGTSLMVIEKGQARGKVSPKIYSPQDWNQYAAALEEFRKTYPRLELKPQSAIIKSGEKTNEPDPATASVVRQPAGQPKKFPGRQGDGGGSVDVNVGRQDRPAAVHEESKPVFGGEAADDVGAGPANERPAEDIKPGKTSRKRIGKFIQYQKHNNLPYVSKHPSIIVEPEELSSVDFPKITYQPSKNLLDIYKSKRVSDEQMDVVLLAMQSIEKGKGFVIADNVGVGKTREMAAIISELIETKKANRVLYVTVNEDVLNGHIAEDFSQVMTGKSEQLLPYKMVRLEGFPNLSKQSNLPLMDRAIYTITRNRLAKHYAVIKDLGIDSIVFDEAHQWNSPDENKGKLIAWDALHKQMEGKPIIYATATPGTDLESLKYLYGLNLWKRETFDNFIESITGNQQARKGMYSSQSAYSAATSVPLTQQVMREMKMRGMYASRDLSREGVEFRNEKVDFMPTDVKEYDRYVKFLKKTYEVAVKYARFDKVKGKRSLGLVKSMMQFAAKRKQLDLKIEKLLPKIEADIKAGRRVFLLTEGLNKLDEIAPKGYLRGTIDKINEDQVEKIEGEIFSDKIPEAIEEKANLLDEISQFPEQLSIEDFVKEKFGEKYKVANYTGNTSDANRKKSLQRWQKGEIDILLGSKAAKTAISAHDIIGKRIVNYYLDIDFEVQVFWQALGRTNRAGEVTSPIVIIPHIGAAGEQKFISTIAARMKNLRATSAGQAESGVVDFLSEFDLEGSIAHQAAREAFQEFDNDMKELFLNDGLWETDPEGGRRVKRMAPKDFYVDNYLFDLNFMPYDKGNEAFKMLIDKYKEILNRSSDLMDLKAEKLAGKVLKKTVLHDDPAKNDKVILNEVVDKTGSKFGVVTGMLTIRSKILRSYEAKHYVKFNAGNETISGLKILPSYIPGLAKEFGKDIASSITNENVFDVLMAGDKVPVGGSMELYLRQDKKAIGIKNAVMKDKIPLQKAGASYQPVGNIWLLKPEKENVAKFLEYYPLAQQEKKGKTGNEIIAEGFEKLEIKRIEEQLGKSSVDDIDFMHAGIPLPQSVRKAVNDEIKQPATFTDPEIEARFKAANGVGTKTGIIDRIKQMFDEVFRRSTRVYPLLPNRPQYAEFRNTLNKQQFAKSNGQDRAIRAIEAILAGFGPKKLDVFTRKVILDDLLQEKLAGRALPFGYSDVDDEGNIIYKENEFQADYAKINAIVEANPDIKEALDKRKQLWDAIGADLVEAGILKEEQLKTNYFRHQVLEYARAKATFSTGKKLKTPTPGYAKKRRGSTLDINTNYLEAEFEVMSQALHDVETVKNIEQIENSDLNIKPQLVEQAKEEGGTWRDRIPEGYTTWQPLEGNVFFMAHTVPQRIINEVLDGVEVGLAPEDIRKVLAVGAKRKEFVLPVEVAETLNNLFENRNPNFITQGAKTVTTAWKKWILMNPRRLLKYNYQNFIGDLDAVIAGDPAILKKFVQANSELYDVFYKGKPVTPAMREFVERGGISTQMTVQELPELRKMDIFLRLSNDPAASVKKQLNLWERYWQTVATLTTYRESILRYAAYLHYKDAIAAGKKINYGASIKSEVDALSDPDDRAAKLATELLGDYSNITALGKDMRESVVPFYSWLEINFKRYNQLFRNSFEEGWEKGIKVSATVAGIKGSFFLTKWMLRAYLLTGIMALANHLFHPDEEEELSEYDKNRVHINLGRDKDGNVRILRGQTAFSDILEWLGLNNSPTLWREVTEGKSSIADVFGRIPNTDLPAFGLNPMEGKVGLHQATMKIIRGVNPLYKLPFETMTGKSLPVFDDRSWRVEDKMRNILKAVSLENEYDYLMKEPTRGYKRSLAEALITTQDPEENAYRYIQGEKYKFLETVKGRGGSGDYYSPRSALYRKYKKALRYNDTEAKARIESEMRKMGISQKDIQLSLSKADPLSGMNKADKREFVYHYLTQRDREIYLKRANEYYRKTFLRK